MCDNFEQSIDTLEIASKIIGKTAHVTINSHVYDHHIFDDDHELNEADDQIIIRGSKKTPITMSRILRAFKQMQGQFDNIRQLGLEGRSYYYEGYKCNETNDKFDISWGS